MHYSWIRSIPWNSCRDVVLGLVCLCLLATAVSARPVLAEPAAPSQSKLSIHQLSGYTLGASDIIQSHPRVLKIVGTNPIAAMQAARDYKASTPDGKLVFREYTSKRFYLSHDPAESARYFWQQILRPPLDQLSPADRALIDYVEGPNECDSTPCWANPQSNVWFNDFWMTLAPLIAEAGFKPCAFSIPVGNPPGPTHEVHAALDRIAPALRLAKSLNGAWSYHSYTLPYTTDPGQEINYSLRHRRFYDYFATAHTDLLDLPILLTEGGVDGQISPDGSGWKGGGDAEKYKNWLSWYDQQIRQDDYVLGVTLFQSGSADWFSFEVEPIAGWLAGHLVTQGSMPQITVSPTEITPAVTQGDHLAASAFTISNSGGEVLHYTLSTNADWMSITPTNGSSSGATITHTIEYSVSNLVEGSYDAMIMITAHEASNSPRTLAVQLTVKSPWYHGDFDHDWDVDQSDFGCFQGCLTGPGTPQTDPGCLAADIDRDADVDIDDLLLFQACLSGANIPAGPGCLD